MDRWVRLHTNFPHHRAGVLRLLACEPEKTAVQNALSKWDAETFEEAAAQAGLVVAMARTFAQWDAHPHGRAVSNPAADRIGTDRRCAAEPLTPGAARLQELRVLELARVLAGPDLRPVACRPWRRCPAGDCGALADVRGRGRGYRPRQALGACGPRHRRRRASVADVARGRGRHGAVLPAGNAGAPRLRSRGGGTAASGHRLCLAVGLWPRGTVGRPPRLRQPGADDERPELRRGRGSRGRYTARAPLPGARPCCRLPGWRSAQSRACCAGPKPAGAGSCGFRWCAPASGCAALAGFADGFACRDPELRGRRRPHRGSTRPATAPARRNTARCRAVGDARAMGATFDAVRLASAGLAAH